MDAVARLVKATGCTPAEALEEWGTRAAHMEYDAHIPRAEAERLAEFDAAVILGEMVKGRR